MLFKRLMASICIAALLAGCAPVTVRGGDGANFWSEYHSCDNSSSPRTIHDESGGGSLGFAGDGDAGLVLAIIVISAVGIYYAACEGADRIERLSKPPLPGTLQDGVYRAPYDLYAVAVPGDFSADGLTGVKVHEVTSQSQEQVFFLPQGEAEATYAVSVIPRLPLDYDTLPLTAFAAKVAPVPLPEDSHSIRWGTGLKLLHEEQVTLDGRPAVFRVYAQMTHSYLLYIIKSGRESALLSVAWSADCPKCATGPEAEIRAMDPHLKQFVESFHLAPVAN